MADNGILILYNRVAIFIDKKIRAELPALKKRTFKIQYIYNYYVLYYFECPIIYFYDILIRK